MAAAVETALEQNPWDKIDWETELDEELDQSIAPAPVSILDQMMLENKVVSERLKSLGYVSVGGDWEEELEEEDRVRKKELEAAGGFGAWTDRAITSVTEFLQNLGQKRDKGGVGDGREKVEDRDKLEQRKGFLAGLSEMRQKAQEMLDVAQDKAKNWFGRWQKIKPAEDDNGLSLKERMEAWKPKITREQAGEFLEIHGVNAVSLVMGLFAGAELGQNAPMLLEAAGMTMFAVGQLGLMVGKERGVAEIADTEPKFKRVTNAIQRACSNSAVRTGLRIIRSGGLGLAITTMPDVLRHLSGTGVATGGDSLNSLQGQAPLPTETVVGTVTPSGPDMSYANQLQTMGEQTVNQAQQAAAHGAEIARTTAGEQAQQLTSQLAEAAARTVAEQTAQQAVAQAAEVARLAAEQAAIVQQAAVDALRAGQTMAEMAQNMSQGTAHEAAYQILSRVAGLENHVGEATQTILNGLRAQYGEARGLDIFNKMTVNELRAAGEFLAEKFRGVPQGGLPIDNSEAYDVLQAANISWKQAGDVASRVWNNIMTARPILKTALGL